jgi:hypothetical protein
MEIDYTPGEVANCIEMSKLLSVFFKLKISLKSKGKILRKAKYA